jgi:hypothetical protein
MGSAVVRFAAISRVARSIAITFATFGIMSVGAEAQQAKPDAPTTFSGCVQKAPGSTTVLVISTPTVCATLKGKFSEEKLAGHEVDLKGVLTPGTAAVASSIQVRSVGSVGKSCSEVCSLHPPAKRGLSRKEHEIPGSEGGTPGVVAPPPP